MKIDTDTESLIRELYVVQKMGQAKTAAYFGRTPLWLTPRLKALNIPIRGAIEAHRQFTINESYFKRIDTHAKAYVFGFIYADGCVHVPKSPEGATLSKRLQIVIQERDKEVLQFIAKDMDYTGRIVEVINDGFQYSRIVIPSNQICDDLTALGCHPRKSLTALFPTTESLPDEFLSSFLCGFFDGDGGYGMTHRPTGACDLGVQFAISYDMGLRLKDILKERFGIKAYFSRGCEKNDKHKQPREHIWVLRFGGNLQVLPYCAWMYSLTPFKLARKHAQYLKVRALYDENLVYVKSPEWIARKAARCSAASRKRVLGPESIKRMSESALASQKRTDVTLMVKSPDGIIHYSNKIRPFRDEFMSQYSNHNGFYRLMGNKTPAYKGWTRATPEEVTAARANGILVEKLY